MPITAHVYQIYIAATPEQVWSAITDSTWTVRYLHGTAFTEPPAAGRPYLSVRADGSPAVDGVIEECDPPAPGRPGRFVQTWHVRYDPELEAERPGRVEWTVEAAGEGLTRVRLVHGDLAESPLTWQSVKDGWVWVLDGLKTVLETGRSLPRATADLEEASSGPADGAWHRREAVAANNSAWELLDLPQRTAEDAEQLLRRAYAAAYHWERAAGGTPANQARSAYLIARALLVTAQPQAALASADRCLAICEGHGLADFDLAYAHEARARALAGLGREPEAAEEWRAARDVPVADPRTGGSWPRTSPRCTDASGAGSERLRPYPRARLRRTCRA